MNYTLDELIRANNNGTLESLMLSNGQLPLNVLSKVLTQAEVSLSRMNHLVGDLEDMVDELREERDELKRTPF